MVDGDYTVLQLIRAMIAVYKAGADRRSRVYTDSQVLHHAGVTLDLAIAALPDAEADGATVLIAGYTDEAFDFVYDPGSATLARGGADRPRTYRQKRATEVY